MNDIKINTEKIDISNLNQLQIVGRQTFFETYSIGNTEEDMNKYLADKFSVEQLSNELNNPNSKFYFAKIEKDETTL